jgi:hypothetical protein
MKTMLRLLVCLACVIPALADDDAVLKQRVAGLARKVNADGYGYSTMGLMAEVSVYKPTRNPSKNKGAEPFLWTRVAQHHAVIQDSDTKKSIWSGKAWRIGSIKYVTRQGFWNTLPLYTASEEKALAFYKEHGFTVAAAEYVREYRK